MGDHGAMACAAAAQAQGARKDWGLQSGVREEFSVFRLCCLRCKTSYFIEEVDETNPGHCVFLDCLRVCEGFSVYTTALQTQGQFLSFRSYWETTTASVVRYDKPRTAQSFSLSEGL